MANGSFGHTAFAADVFARMIAGRACATSMGTGGRRRGRWNRRYHGPPRTAARTIPCAVPAMARGASASCTPPGPGNSARLPRPARSATRTATPWPGAPTARAGPSPSGGASPSRIRGTRSWRRSGGPRGGGPNRPHRPLGHRTPERTETGYHTNQAAQAAPL